MSAPPKEKVELTVNIGWIDADRIGLPYESIDDLKEGETVETEEAVAKEMINRGWAKEPAKKSGQKEAPKEPTKPEHAGSSK